MDVETDDRVDEIYNAMLDEIEKGEFAAADVMYAIGMLIAQGIKNNAVDKRVSVTMDHIKAIVELELELP